MLPEITRLWLSSEACMAMLRHLVGALPEEGCGLLAGPLDEDGLARAQVFLPVENELHSPVRFRMAPAAQLAALQRIETLGLELVGIVHSHPSGPRHPSPTDMAEFYYPGVPALIVSPSPAGGWQAGAFQIETTGYRSIALDGCEGAHPGPLSWVII